MSIEVIRFSKSNKNKINKYGLLKKDGKVLFMGGVIKPIKNHKKDKNETWIIT